jgi:hypothetical protein
VAVGLPARRTAMSWKSPLTGVEYLFTVVPGQTNKKMFAIIEVDTVEDVVFKDQPEVDFYRVYFKDGNNRECVGFPKKIVSSSYLPLIKGDKLLSFNGAVEIEGMTLPVMLEFLEKKL